MKTIKFLLFILVMSLPMFAQTTTYQLGTNYGALTFTCWAASKQPINSPEQFNCQGVPLLSNGVKVGSLQLLNENGTVQVHVPGVVDPQQYLISKLKADQFQFSLPSPSGPGHVVFNYEITDNNGNVFHGTVSTPWTDYDAPRTGWHYPQLVSANGTLTIASGPLQ